MQKLNNTIIYILILRKKNKLNKSRDFLPISFLLSENAEQNSSTISCIKTTSLGKLLRMQELPFQGAQCFPCIMQ